jgi:hypothetical protein
VEKKKEERREIVRQLYYMFYPEFLSPLECVDTPVDEPENRRNFITAAVHVLYTLELVHSLCPQPEGLDRALVI